MRACSGTASRKLRRTAGDSDVSADDRGAAVPDERTQAAHFALVGLAIVVALSGLVAAFLHRR